MNSTVTISSVNMKAVTGVAVGIFVSFYCSKVLSAEPLLMEQLDLFYRNNNYLIWFFMAMLIVVSAVAVITLILMLLRRTALEDEYIQSQSQLDALVEKRAAELTSIPLACADALRGSERQKRLILETLPDLIWLKDLNGVYLACNPTFERFFGAKEEDIIGKTDYDFVGKSLADFFTDRDRAAMRVDQPTSNEEWITFSDNGHRALLYTTKTPLKSEDGRVVGILGVGRDITKIKQAEEKLKQTVEDLHQENLTRKKVEDKIRYMAQHDPLTHLFNRHQFYEFGESILGVAQQNMLKPALLFIDIDGFKAVNDTYGHCVGDVLLQNIAIRLKAMVTDSDILARIGGDEFAVLIVEELNDDDMCKRAAQIVSAFSAPFHIENHSVSIGASVGVAFYPRHGEGLDELLKYADMAMYSAKHQGKGCYQVAANDAR